MSWPLIGITGRGMPAQRIPGVPVKLSSVPVDAHFRNYATRVADAGGLPVQLTVASDPAQISERLDALVLSGGADIDPARYGRVSEPGLQGIDPERDEFEYALLSHAKLRGIPILGICRGMQFMNISLGGTMLQDITPLQAAVEHNFSDGPPEHVAHRVVTEEGSLARSIYGESTWTTSSHHQAVDDLGRDLRVTGRADDGFIEILENTSLHWLGVQWHAEWQEPIDSAFHWLVQATHTASAEGE